VPVTANDAVIEPLTAGVVNVAAGVLVGDGVVVVAVGVVVMVAVVVSFATFGVVVSGTWHSESILTFE